MNEAFIFDAVRTPRGKGKKDGSLHVVTPVHLLGNLFSALESRNSPRDTSQVDDVVRCRPSRPVVARVRRRKRHQAVGQQGCSA